MLRWFASYSFCSFYGENPLMWQSMHCFQNSPNLQKARFASGNPTSLNQMGSFHDLSWRVTTYYDKQYGFVTKNHHMSLNPTKDCHQMSWNVFQFNMPTFDDMLWHVMMWSIWFREAAQSNAAFWSAPNYFEPSYPHAGNFSGPFLGVCIPPSVLCWVKWGTSPNTVLELIVTDFVKSWAEMIIITRMWWSFDGIM